MSKWDKEYIKLCKNILKNGVEVENRTGINTIKLPFYSFTFDVGKEFPILTTKKVAFKSATIEMLWFYQAQSNDVRWLQERNVKIWNEWEINEDGTYQGKNFGKNYAHTIGTAYGYIVNKYKMTQKLIETIKNNPTDRRMIMSLWQNEYLETASLPSCVWNSMWDVTDGKLNCIVTQRSCDVALGLPFNVTQYAVLLSMIAKVTNLKVGKLYYNIKDAHIYTNQIEGIKKQIEIYETKGDFKAPKLWLNPEIDDFFKFDNSASLNDIKLIDYKHHEKIEMPVAI